MLPFNKRDINNKTYWSWKCFPSKDTSWILCSLLLFSNWLTFVSQMKTFISFLEDMLWTLCHLHRLSRVVNFHKIWEGGGGPSQCKLPHCRANIAIYWASTVMALCERWKIVVKSYNASFSILLENLFTKLILSGENETQGCGRI